MIRKDAIIIGSEQAAKSLSQKLSEAGWETVMMEKSESDLGGTKLGKKNGISFCRLSFQ